MQSLSRRKLLTGAASMAALVVGSPIRAVAQSAFPPFINVKDIAGVDPNGGNPTATTAGFNTALANGSMIVPPGIYNLNGGVDIAPNGAKRAIHVMPGAVITNNGGRFSGYAPLGSLDFRNDGDMGFVNTAQAPSLGDWLPMGNDQTGYVAQRGLIEYGGSNTDRAWGVNIYGIGRVFGDYPWANAPGLTNWSHQLNRKGVCILNSNRVRVENLRVHNIYGEAVYFSGNNCIDVQFNKLTVHTVAFDALNFNCFTGSGFVMNGNFVNAAFCGIECSVGTILNNRVNYCWSGLAFGGGGGQGPIIINGNIFQTIFGVGISAEFAYYAQCEQLDITDNIIDVCSSHGITVDQVGGLLVTGNNIKGWGGAGPAYGISVRSGVRRGLIAGNVGSLPASSLGFVQNSSPAVVGTNTIL